MLELFIKIGTIHYNSPEEEKLNELWEMSFEHNYVEELKELGTVLLFPKLNSGHATSYNERYYIYFATKNKGVQINYQHEVVQSVIRNGMSGYFEKTTHERRPLLTLLKEQDVVISDEDVYIPKEEPDGYFNLSLAAIERMVKLHNIGENEMEVIVIEMCLAALSVGGHSARESTILHLGGNHPRISQFPPFIKKFVRPAFQEELLKELKPYLPILNEQDE